MALIDLSEEERAKALERYTLLQPYLEGHCSLQHLIKTVGLKYRTARRWVRAYHEKGLAGLVRQSRRDKGHPRLHPTLQSLIEGLALQKTRPSAASIHRQIIPNAQQQGWKVPSYSCVYTIIRTLDPALVTLAHEGTKAYQQQFDLLYRRQAQRPNEIWQADHCLLDIWLHHEDGSTARPWLTVIQDDYSQAITGYYLNFKHPNTLSTALALRQAIWRKDEALWPMCGIPDQFYTDNGRDFTSRHMEQVSADLKIQLIFSTPGMPRGRGRIERFFKSMNQLFLHMMPGYGSEGKPLSEPGLTLAQFDIAFRNFVLGIYHQRLSDETRQTPTQRWYEAPFIPRMPLSLEQLDLLLIMSATTRRVQRDGIRLHNLRYMATTLAAFIGEEVVIRYDPRDMAEIRVYCRDQFVCRALCQELETQTISLQEIISTRTRRRRELRQHLETRQQVVDTYLGIHQSPPSTDPAPVPPSQPSLPQLKRYANE
jgi:putative transposase